MIELKQRKKCGSCRCFKGGVMATCELRFTVKQDTNVFRVVVNGLPQEPCPKPLTASDYIESLKHYSNGR